VDGEATTRTKAPPVVSVLAIVALCLAFLGILGAVTAPLAFLLGVITLVRARRGPQLDLVFGVLALAVSVVAGLAGLAIDYAIGHEVVFRRIDHCQGKLYAIGDALLDYAADHGDQLPAPKSEAELHALLAPYLGTDDDIWTCRTGARYILNPDLAGWYLDELDEEYDILVCETFDGHSMVFPHHGFGWPDCGNFYFADETVDWLEPGDIDDDGPVDGLRLPGAGEYQPL